MSTKAFNETRKTAKLSIESCLNLVFKEGRLKSAAIRNNINRNAIHLANIQIIQTYMPLMKDQDLIRAKRTIAHLEGLHRQTK